MATLDDKLLGEKLEYYCSSSEDENDNASDESDNDENEIHHAEPQGAAALPPELNEWDGSSSNTGPKGVIRDWQRYKQLKAEKRAQQDHEKVELMKKLSLTCQSALEEEKQKLQEEDPDLADLLTDEFLLEYQRKRMKEMIARAEKMRFGTVLNLTDSEQFLDCIDKEDKSVTIVVHVYEEDIPGCDAMNGSLVTLAQEYPHVKFCKIMGSAAGLSKHFKKEGVPALLIYKGGQMVGNFVRVTDSLGTDFYSGDVESFLLEHGMIFDKNCIPAIVKNANNDDESD